MKGHWFAGLLWAGVWLSLPQAGLAGPFCVVDFAGKRCWFQDVESCRQAAGPQGSCVVNSAEIVAPLGGARYCVVESWQTQCIYKDEGSCRQAAERRRGECITNPNDMPHGPGQPNRRRDQEAGGGFPGNGKSGTTSGTMGGVPNGTSSVPWTPGATTTPDNKNSEKSSPWSPPPAVPYSPGAGSQR
ncbi:MAG: hypothetical protein H7833_02375 [Magnetococcus sp. DMHC-1]|nr:hypothetical protein [Magnetococcales bacterium]